MLSPKDSPIGKLLRQYVAVRVTRMDDVDLELFDYDRHNTLYFFIMNADEQIYLRYGGRDSKSQDSYLNLGSLAVAMEQGLALHRSYLAGELKKTERPKPRFAREIPLLVERTFKQNACVECHLIGEYQSVHREQDGTLDKLTHMYRSPDIKMIGIHLDVPRGLVVKETTDAALAGGMKPGDRIAALNGTPVWTFGDFQHYYDKVDRRAASIRITVDRSGGPMDLSVALPHRWWWTDLEFRHMSIDPRVFFDARPLTAAEKRQHGFDPDGLASQVTGIDAFRLTVTKSHELKVGDIVFAVNGVQRDEIANTVELYVKLRVKAGETVTLDVIRDGQRMQTKLKTHRISFRR